MNQENINELLNIKNKLNDLSNEQALFICRNLREFDLHDEDSLKFYCKVASNTGKLDEVVWSYQKLDELYYPNLTASFLINYYTFLNKSKNYAIAAKHFVENIILNDVLEEAVFNKVNNFIYEKYNIGFLESLINYLEGRQDNVISDNTIIKLVKLVKNIRKKGLRYSYPIAKIIAKFNEDMLFDELDIKDRYLFNNANAYEERYYKAEYSIGNVFNFMLSNPTVQFVREYNRDKIAFFTDTLEMGGNERNAVFTAIESEQVNYYADTLLLHYSSSETYNHWATYIEKFGLTVVNLNDEWVDGSSYVEPWIIYRLNFIEEIFKDFDLVVKDFSRQIKQIFLKLVSLDISHIHCFASDTKCIMLGIAAVLAGIPVISLNPGSMSPATRLKIRPEIEYFLYSGYKALLNFRQVNVFFCSIAACLDYKNWLSMFDSQKFHVNYVSIVNDYIERSSITSNKAKLPRKMKDEVIIVGCFRFHPVKRPLLWIKIALALAKSYDNVKFYLVGNGVLLEECKILVNKSNMKERFVFLGAVEDPSFVYEHADLTYMTSISEGLGNVILEAESFGVVPVVPYVGGMPETVIHGKNGFICQLDELNIDEMLNYLGKLIENSYLRKDFSDFSRYFVGTNFGRYKMLNNVLSVVRN